MKSLKRFIKKHNRIFCYGAGDFGDDFYIYTQKKGLSFDSYIVTCNQQGIAMRHGKMINVLADTVFDEGDGVVIAVGKNKAHDEIYDSLLFLLDSKDIYDLHNDLTFSRFQRRRYLQLSKQRKSASIFDYINLSKEIVYHHTEGAVSFFSYRYGIGYWLKAKYAKHNLDITGSTIDHGARIQNVIFQEERNPPNATVFCMSDFIWKQLEHCNIYPLGPYLQYVKPLYSMRKMYIWKTRLGKCLLVFPPHSLQFAKVKYDESYFITQILKVKAEHGFDSVIVCMYYQDILDKRHIVFQQNGMRVVTAGHRDDYNFLRRLYSIILLSDMAVVNDFSTCIGYCIYAGRPVYYIDMYVDDDWQNDYVPVENGFNQDSYNNYLKIEREIFDRFKRYDENIHDYQYEIIEKYWGKWRKHGLWQFSK